MPEDLITVIAIGLLTGGLVGTIGVGGILLSPLLALVAGVDLQQAMAVASASFLATGIAGTAAYARKRSIDWRMLCWLSLGLAPAAIAGARVNQVAGTTWLSLVLAMLIAGAGVHALLPGTRRSTLEHVTLAPPSLILIGGAVGFGSALTGTGGPVLLLPILMPLGVPVLAAIGVSQVVQLPIAVAATLTHGLVGELDVQLAVWLGVIQVVGVVVGAALAHRLPAERLRKLVAWSLLAVAIVLAVRYF